MALLPEGFYQKPSQYNPQAQGALSSVLARGQQNITNPSAGFDPIRQATTSHFMQNIIPRINEQFSASGDNAQSSPVLHHQLAQAGSGLAEKLASLQAQFGQRQEDIGTRQLGLGLSHPTEDFYTQPSQWQQPLQSLLGGFGASIPGLAEVGLKHYLGQRQQNKTPGTQDTSGTGSSVGNLAGALAPVAGTALAGGLGAGAASTAAGGGLLAGLSGAAAAAAPFAVPAAIAGAIGLGIFGLYKLLED